MKKILSTLCFGFWAICNCAHGVDPSINFVHNDGSSYEDTPLSLLSPNACLELMANSDIKQINVDGMNQDVVDIIENACKSRYKTLHVHIKDKQLDQSILKKLAELESIGSKITVTDDSGVRDALYVIEFGGLDHEQPSDIQPMAVKPNLLEKVNIIKETVTLNDIIAALDSVKNGSSAKIFEHTIDILDCKFFLSREDNKFTCKAENINDINVLKQIIDTANFFSENADNKCELNLVTSCMLPVEYIETLILLANKNHCIEFKKHRGHNSKAFVKISNKDEKSLVVNNLFEDEFLQRIFTFNNIQKFKTIGLGKCHMKKNTAMHIQQLLNTHESLEFVAIAPSEISYDNGKVRKEFLPITNQRIKSFRFVEYNSTDTVLKQLSSIANITQVILQDCELDRKKYKQIIDFVKKRRNFEFLTIENKRLTADDMLYLLACRGQQQMELYFTHDLKLINKSIKQEIVSKVYNKPLENVESLTDSELDSQFLDIQAGEKLYSGDLTTKDDPILADKSTKQKIVTAGLKSPFLHQKTELNPRRRAFMQKKIEEVICMSHSGVSRWNDYDINETYRIIQAGNIKNCDDFLRIAGTHFRDQLFIVENLNDVLKIQGYDKDGRIITENVYFNKAMAYDDVTDIYFIRHVEQFNTENIIRLLEIRDPKKKAFWFARSPQEITRETKEEVVAYWYRTPLYTIQALNDDELNKEFVNVEKGIIE